MSTVEVLATGPSATVQDLGRPGHAHLGVGRSGALDRRSLALAHRLLGNPEDAAGLEVLGGGLVLRPTASLLLAVTGAPGPVRVGTRAAEHGAVLRVGPGEQVEVGAATYGLRRYVAVAGGWAVDPVLGSRSYDSLAGLGPLPLTPGDRLPVGSSVSPPELLDPVAQRHVRPGPVTLRCRIGPRHDWLRPESLDRLLTATWTVSSETDRVGARLEGPRLAYGRDGQLASEAMVHGAVQVPPSGAPIVFLADHGTVGGYPVVVVVVEDDLDLLAQAPPGTAVRLRRIA